MDEVSKKKSEINRQLINSKGQIVELQKIVNYITHDIFDLQQYVEKLEKELYNLG